MRSDLRILVEGSRLEKLIRMLTDSGARFHRIHRPDANSIIVECDPKNGRALLALCERFSVSARVLRQSGHPALARFLKARRTLPAGFLACACACALALSRIWFIDICFTGEKAHDGIAREIRSILSDHGIRPGMSDNIDTFVLSQTLQAEAEGCGFITARVQGMRLVIETAPETGAPDLYDIDRAQNLYAATDGIVISVNVRSGSACVKKGDIIRKGQLLILGQERVSAEETRSIAALGEVMVRTWYTGEARASAQRTVREPTGKSDVSVSLQLMDHSIPLTNGKTYPIETVQTERVPIGGLFLPLDIVRETHREVTERTVSADLEALSDDLVALSLADAAHSLCVNGPADYEIARCWVNFDREGDDSLRAQGVYEIYTDAAAAHAAIKHDQTVIIR